LGRPFLCVRTIVLKYMTSCSSYTATHLCELFNRGVIMYLRKITAITMLAFFSLTAVAADDAARIVMTPYDEPNIVYDFYFDEPAKINSALYWIRSLMNPLMEEPYNMAPEFMNIKVVIHGTEIVTVARKNYEKYKDAVERMRYYASLGVEFKVCGIAAHDYGYTVADFQEFIEVVPSAINELAHWQLQGYALITPTVMEKKFTIEEIR
jgi:intracellular sulfur oxidation DsrE/DsrF family protein